LFKANFSGLLFGVALAGFLDGIALHSILQWHHMLSGRIPADTMERMKLNMLADGFFDLLCWLLTIAALVLLFRAAKDRRLPRAKVYTGWILIGAGAFNFIEGLIDHEILGVHHVHPQTHWLAWDIGFLIVGGLIPACIGWLLRRDRQGNVVPIRRAA
jgi:uncharacterized membrane protein